MGTLNSNKAWIDYGQQNPYYGVLAHDKYLGQNLTDEVKSEFFSSGHSYVEELFTDINKHFDPEFAPKKILDFGCGTGRLVIPFSKYAEDVVGLDISPAIIKEAQLNCEKYHVNNTSFHLSDDSLSNIKGQKFDLINTYIVLQHINKERGEKIIKMMLGMLNTNGIALIHLKYKSDISSSKKFINYFRYRIPLFNNFLNLARNKPFNLPLMQMTEYDLNEVCYMLQQNKIPSAHISFTDHEGHLGIKILFQKK